MTRSIEQVLLANITAARGDQDGKTDGRKLRWEQHRLTRRTDLIDGAIGAVHELGADVGMDDIATHIGVSKTVLYRYFTDKNDLRLAMAARIFESTILPRLTSAITDDADEYSLTRSVIDVYVTSVADEPNLYRFALTSQSGDAMISADSEKLVIELITVLITMRLTERGADISGVGVWAHALVGSITRSVDWWMAEGGDSVGEVIDYLTMFVWSSIVGIVAVNGSREEFLAAPPRITPP